MNTLSLADFRERFYHRIRIRIRILDPARRVPTFSRTDDPASISRIYAINLDRKPDRWRPLRREFARFSDQQGQPLTAMLRRFSAIDACHMDDQPEEAVLNPVFTLADQLTVAPHYMLQVDDATRAREITMSQQEVAVALSHIEVWKLVAAGDAANVLVLEDDVFLPFGFSRQLRRSWQALMDASRPETVFDLLYLSYKDVGGTITTDRADIVRRREPGLWQASGYVLTRVGAQKLLDLLPVRGPVDLWLNLQFDKLRVYTTPRPIIEQRIDEPSTNSYSVLPVLSQVGVLSREKPLLAKSKHRRKLIVATGGRSTGLTALSKALSMLGYTCVSDIDQLPDDEHAALLSGRGQRTFNAYVNIGSLDDQALAAIARSNPTAKFITTSDYAIPDVRRSRVLMLDPITRDKWASISEFLNIDYPSFPFPGELDLGQRATEENHGSTANPASIDLEWDPSPWVARRGLERAAVSVLPQDPVGSCRPEVHVDWSAGNLLDPKAWRVRDDTFPSNLALFTLNNFSQKKGRSATLTFDKNASPVREFSSAAIASRGSYLYGSFSTTLRPSGVPGLITGFFLHRNGPRQEIDIEFLGKDATKMLVNVYYNPGPEGTKLEYGYRGTPTQIDLGFDASDAFHTYEIEWLPNVIRWKVDGTTVYERSTWNPTPIPDQPLELNVNLWYSRSPELSGPLTRTDLPSSVDIRSISIRSHHK